MAIQFKFRSSVNFDSVDIEGRPSISVADLKSKIIRMKNLDSCQNFDLVLIDALTGQDLVDEKFEIPSGSCVIIKRVPAGSVPSKAHVVHRDLFGNFQVKDNDMVNSSRPLISETDNFDDFGVDLYPIRKAKPSISYNSTNNDAARHYKEIERGYIEPEGSSISEAIQGDSGKGTKVAGTEQQTNIKLNVGDGIDLEKPVVALDSVIHNREIPSELKCSLCNSLFVDAVITGCCKHSFCGKCIHCVLLEKKKCPKCASTKYKPEDLLPNLSLRQNIAHFLESQILMGDSDNACHHNAPDEESRIEGKDTPCLSYVTGRGFNQEVVDVHDSSLRRNMKIKVDGAEFGSCHLANFGGRPEDLPPFDDCQGESQPVFGDLEHEVPNNAFGKIQNLTDFRRPKKRGRACYMCGSLDHFIRDCPVASKPPPMHPMGAMPHYASPWHHVSTFTNPYGCPMAFNTPMAPNVNSYWPCLYGGYPVPSGFMGMGGMTAPPLGKTEEFCPGYSEFIDVNDFNKIRKIPDNCTRGMPFTNDNGSERHDDISKCQYEWDERSRECRMLEEKERPCRENAMDEINRLYGEKRKSSHSSKDAMINGFNHRLNLDIEGMPCSSKSLTKERSGHHHSCSREVGVRTGECCSRSCTNHHKRCKDKEDKMNTAEVDVKRHTQKHVSCPNSDLDRNFSRNPKLLQKETSFMSRCSKRNELTHDQRRMVGGPNDNREECNHKYKPKRFVKNYGSEF